MDVTPSIELDESENAPLGQELVRRLVEYNLTQVPASNRRPFLLSARDGQRLVAGAQGFTHWGWMFVAHFWVAEDQRGHGLGSQLLARVEDLACARQCRHIWLDTFSFQALRFYQKHGYVIFGHLPDYPVGHTRNFLFKSVVQDP